MSLSLNATRLLVGLRPSMLSSAEALRRGVANPPRPAPVPASLRRRCTVSIEKIAGFDVVTLVPHGAAHSGRHVLYFHGGAYVSPLITPHWWLLSALLDRTPAALSIPLYPRAPEYVVDDALSFLDAAVPSLTDRYEGRLVYAGDSAGGGLALAQAIRQRDGAPGRTPDALVLFAPWVDVTMTNEGIAPLERRDSMLFPEQLRQCGAWWAGRRSSTDPLVSPLYANLSGLPPMWSFVGDHDLLLPDVVELRERVVASGGSCQLTVARGGFHVYVGAPWTPEARRAIDIAASVVGGNTTR
ncbi:alpha/beta hydrolase [Mycolicibacterium psychrotolerans]|uniref:alpha/beta hydrolase n=1 Tax=Mycolicibacterium psychrotolerans TaxID=216929 RepID=UPI003D67A7B3